MVRKRKKSKGRERTPKMKYIETVYTYGDYLKDRKAMLKYQNYKKITMKKGKRKLPNGKKKTVYHIYGER